MEQADARTYEELVWLAKERGYQRPEVWAGFVLRARERAAQRGQSVRRWAGMAPPPPKSNG